MMGWKRLAILGVLTAVSASGVALAVAGLLGVDDVTYAPTFVLTSVQASLLGNGKVGYSLAGYAKETSALTLHASCVWDPRTGTALENVNFGTGKVLSKSFCPGDPWVQDVPCTLKAANGSDPDMGKLSERFKFGWPLSARVLYGERSKVIAALENASSPAPPTPTPRSHEVRNNAPTPTPISHEVRNSAPTPTPTPATITIHVGPPGILLPDYAAAYSVPLFGGTLKPGQQLTLDIGVTNKSSKTWPANGLFRLSYHWYQGATAVVFDGKRTFMPSDVKPFGTVTLHASCVAPSAPGTYTLKWDMVQENVTWFSSKGVATVDRTVVVAP